MKELLHSIFSPTADIVQLSGGDINQVFKVQDKDGLYAVKLNDATHFPNMFKREAEGLQLLGQTLHVPEVIKVGQLDQTQYLILSFIEETDKQEDFWAAFAKYLSNLHQIHHTTFGLSNNNYIGSLVQENNASNTWEEFLVNQRLAPMIEMAVNNGDVNYVESKIIEKFYAKINEIYPNEAPTLVHGDLWGGNFMSAQVGPVFIDPAVYFGHREMDIGMMQLFGGFDSSVFELYNEFHPLEKGWEQRVKYNQLYPLLVHVNLFGRSYWDRVENILKVFK